MNRAPIILDHVRGIALDPNNAPFDNYQAIKSNYIGLKILADTVREIEREYVADNPLASDTLFSALKRGATYRAMRVQLVFGHRGELSSPGCPGRTYEL
jgi:hypothetical protein